MGRQRVHLLVSGVVQGVGYRFSAQRQAHLLGLSGWVKNRRDRRVELLAEGEEEDLRELIRWCHLGPSGARVTEVEEEWHPAEGDLEGFEIRF